MDIPEQRCTCDDMSCDVCKHVLELSMTSESVDKQPAQPNLVEPVELVEPGTPVEPVELVEPGTPSCVCCLEDFNIHKLIKLGCCSAQYCKECLQRMVAAGHAKCAVCREPIWFAAPSAASAKPPAPSPFRDGDYDDYIHFLVQSLTEPQGSIPLPLQLPVGPNPRISRSSRPRLSRPSRPRISHTRSSATLTGTSCAGMTQKKLPCKSKIGIKAYPTGNYCHHHKP